MQLTELEEEIKEIRKIQGRFKPDNLGWNIETIIREKKRLYYLKSPLLKESRVLGLISVFS